MRVPGPGHDLVAGRRPGACAVKRPVQVDVTVGAGRRPDPARATRWLSPGRAELDEGPGGQPARDRAELRVRRLAQIGEQRGRGVRISGQQPGERLGVELADLW